ncbi:malic acid transport protein [Apiospora aurea]|uniref:Malic acid transport protein n=1 Tax=Apiospora aurea TaxID=335848 RepID=A0ABR1QFL1_9PEZI
MDKAPAQAPAYGGYQGNYQVPYTTGEAGPSNSYSETSSQHHQHQSSMSSYQLPHPGQHADPYYATPVDEKRRLSMGMTETQVNSAASSIKGGKEGHDIEKGAAAHGHGHDGIDIFDPNRPKLGLKQRMHHFTWAWFTTSMSTGGLSLLIFAQPHQFPGLRQIGLFVYILNIIIFTLLCAGMVTRFLLHRGDFAKSLSHEREGFFFPTFFLSIATLITSTQRYAIPENDTALIWAIQTAFWLYVIVTLMLAVGQYSFVFAKHNLGVQTMMPTWILPIFPIMLSGTIASVIAETQPEVSAVPIIVAGLTCQGLGISVAFMMYAHMVGRLMSAGLPNREHRPGLFMCVGPPAFTALALIGMANGLPDKFDPSFDGIIDAPIIRTMAVMAAVFLWALAVWWFFIGVIAVIASPPKYFHLGWWAMVFPNTGFVLATITISNELKNEAVRWFATGLSICLLLMFLFVAYNLVRAVIVQDIMYPGRDEDVNDH